MLGVQTMALVAGVGVKVKDSHWGNYWDYVGVILQLIDHIGIIGYI